MAPLHLLPAFLPFTPSSIFGAPLSAPVTTCPITPAGRPLCAADGRNSPARRRRPKRKPSAFENTIEDLTMKRMGRGTIYYGERAPDTDDDQDEEIVPEEELLKPDPVLLAGGTGRTGQWIALGLRNQGFNVRCFTRSFKKAEYIFGPSGSNIDVFEGTVSRIDDVYNAVDGSIAIVYAAGAPQWLPGGLNAVDVKGVRNMVDAAKKAGCVSRFVLISAADSNSPRGKAKQMAEEIVRGSSIPYVIVRTAALNDVEGGLKTIEVEPDAVALSKEKQISRVDLAQCVCQALVYDRAINRLKKEDPEGEFEFPDCVVTVANGEQEYQPDKRFWKKTFNRICDSYQSDREVEADTISK